MNYKPVRI